MKTITTLAASTPLTTRRMFGRALTLAGTLGMMTALSACTPEGGTGKAGTPWMAARYELQAAASCNDVKTRVIDAMTEQLLRERYIYGGRWLEDAAAGGQNNASPAPPSNGEKATPDDYTTTNVQEQGVDEADFVKTDGEHIYTISGNALVILKSWPAPQTAEIGRFTFPEQAYPHSMFLKGDSIVVFGSTYHDNPNNSSDYFSGTRISVIDISDRTAPRLDRQVDLEGWYADARMIDGEVYVVSNSGLRMPQGLWELAWGENSSLPAQEWDADEARQQVLINTARPIMRALVTSALANTSAEDLLPRRRVYDNQGALLGQGLIHQCASIYLPSQATEPGLLNLTHLSLDSKSTITSTGLLASGWQIYASKDNLYVALSSRSWWWGWGSQDNETHLHKFGLPSAGGRPTYKASGTVDGWVLNQFSMSEHNDHLRIATTDNDWTWNQQTGESTVTGGNHLTVLKEQGGQLVVTGAVRDLAPGEQIYSARMMGDRGYMVTFRQTDPLYTFDLSDPTNPQLKGELKINGFSSYIHPLGQDHLLTIGQDADDDGRVTGVHLQVFDVSDMTNPTRAHQEKISTGSWSSWSEAMWDHHAFTYHDGKQLLAFPANIHEWDVNGGENFSGLLVYNASAAGFSEVGRVNHADMARQYYCHINQYDWACTPEREYQWWTSIRRSIFIEDYLFSISDLGVKVNDLLQPQNQHASIMLRASDPIR